MRVLHIEDRRENRLLVRKVLEAKGHTVEDAADGLIGGIGRPCTTRYCPRGHKYPRTQWLRSGYRLRADSALDAVPIVAITAEATEHACSGVRRFHSQAHQNGGIRRPVAVFR